jgi:hypothetical protein
MPILTLQIIFTNAALPAKKGTSLVPDHTQSFKLFDLAK